MIPSNAHPGTAARLRRAFLQAASQLLTARARRPADRVRAKPRLEGLEDRCLLSPTYTEFPLPAAVSNPAYITPGPDGNVWFTEGGANKIGMINPTTDAITEFAVPNAGPEGITAGPDGNLWFTERGANKIGMINPSTHTISEFPLPPPAAKHGTTNDPFAITAGPDGNLWFTEYYSNDIGMISPTTHLVTQFATTSTTGWGITAGSDGNIWFTGGGGVGMINLTTHAITYFAPSFAPGSLTAGPDGNLWFTGSIAVNEIGEINPTTGVITYFATTGKSAYVAAAPDGNLWFIEEIGQTFDIGMINPTTDVITEYPFQPQSISSPDGMTAGPDGLWFTDWGQPNVWNASVGLATLSTSQFVVTQQPPSSIAAGSPFGLTVTAEDSSGNPITSFNGTVTVGLETNPGGATLGGTLTATASNGVATFSGLTLTRAAIGYTLGASGGGYGWGTTSAITVTPLSPTQVAITQQPPGTVKVSTPFSVQASIEDQYGNVVTTASGSVSVAFANNPTGATLGGTLTVNASQGVASFTNLTINKTGSGYTLQVSSSGLTSATSNPINVTKTGNTVTTLSAQAVNLATDLSLAPLALDSPDLWGGLRFKKRPRSV
jgi:streptogramin lyase